MKDNIVINGVECCVANTVVGGKKACFVIPQQVKGVPLVEFSISLCAKNSPTPESEALYLALMVAFYNTSCYDYLLNQREFDLFSLSSDHYPSLRNLCPDTLIKPLGDPLLDKYPENGTFGRALGRKKLG